MEILKEKYLSGWNFLKTKIIQNKLRTAAILCVLLVLFSFFMPFLSAKADISISGVMDHKITIMSPSNEIFGTNLGDFLLQKPIDSLKIFGFELGKLKIFDTSILDVLRSPISDYGIIKNVNTVLNSSALDFLIDPKIQEIIARELNYGKDVNTILTGTWNLLQNLKSIAGAVNDASIQARDSMKQVNAMMASIDSYKGMINGVVLLFFCLLLVLLGSLFYKKVPVGLLIALSGLFFFVFLVLGIGVFFIDGQINSQILGLTSQLNTGVLEGLTAILVGTFGDVGSFIANFIGTRGNFLSMAFYIQLDLGYWFILLGSGVSLVLTILLARQKKTEPLLLAESLVEEAEIVEEAKDLVEERNESMIENSEEAFEEIKEEIKIN